jgi:hypothetical protein
MTNGSRLLTLANAAGRPMMAAHAAGRGSLQLTPRASTLPHSCDFARFVPS